MTADIVRMNTEFKSYLTGKVSSDLYIGFRRLGHDPSALIVGVLYSDGQMKLGTLREKTHLPDSKLTHALDDLEAAHLVLKMGPPGTYTYQLTKLGALLHETATKLNTVNKSTLANEPFNR
jgi:DNA-binding HxlR family transcriptional regulator